tara:strand:- start:1842 stop:2447 length:606 start_codon:yes stop_codon:yes gene_type:complete
MDPFYKFHDKFDSEDNSLKLNMDELFQKKQTQDLNVLNNYNKILIRIHNKIKYVSKQLINDQCCWYIVPEVMLGIPKYDHRDCTIFIIEKLRENGFVVNYIHPNLLFISWKNWIPTYVRNEIKKKTGNVLDEYGNIITNNNNQDNQNNQDNESYNKLDNKTFVFENQNSKNKKSTQFNDIKNYKPSGNLIYNNNLLDKLKI